MSVLSIGGLAVGAGSLGLGIYDAVSGSGGGGKSATSIGNTNPSSGVLNQLFGYVPYLTKDGQVRINPYDAESQYWGSPGIQNGLFGPNFMESLKSYINNPPALGQQTDIQAILAGIPDQLKQTMGLFDQSIIPAAQDLVNTGFRTDMQPVRDYARRQFERVDMPTLAEMFSGQTGTFSTDFLQSGQQAAADMEAQLGALQAQYDESANTRRAQGIPVLGQLATTQMGLPGAAAGDLFDINQRMYQQQQAMDPGLRGFNIFSTLSGLGAPGQQGPVASGQYPSQTSNLLSGLAQAAPGFAQAASSVPWGDIGGWLGNLFTSNSSAPTNSILAGGGGIG